MRLFGIATKIIFFHYEITIDFTFDFDLTDQNECASSPCINKGTCIDKLNEYECLCEDGFMGDNCQFSKLLLFHTPFENWHYP